MSNDEKYITYKGEEITLNKKEQMLYELGIRRGWRFGFTIGVLVCAIIATILIGVS